MTNSRLSTLPLSSLEKPVLAMVNFRLGKAGGFPAIGRIRKITVNARSDNMLRIYEADEKGLPIGKDPILLPMDHMSDPEILGTGAILIHVRRCEYDFLLIYTDTYNPIVSAGFHQKQKPAPVVENPLPPA
jgi:hypothetical protein